MTKSERGIVCTALAYDEGVKQDLGVLYSIHSSKTFNICPEGHII